MSIVIAQNLTKRYGDIIAVDNIDFRIENGEVFGFLGPNGAGKSTAISMITGIKKATSGKLIVLGSEMPKYSNQIKSKIGYVPQDLVFYDYLTIRENLELFARAYEIKDKDNRIHEVSDLLGLLDIGDQRSENLSGGQKRRLNVAIGLLNSPKLLVLDEPSAGMDPQSRNLLWGSIRKMSKEDISIILTTHLMETADALSDRICIIDHGKIKAVGKPRDLKKEYGKDDIVEIVINKDISTKDLKIFKDLLKSNFGNNDVFNFDHTISVTTKDGINSLSEILNLAESTINRENVSNISIRGNSLEDVFIQITGTRLRG